MTRILLLLVFIPFGFINSYCQDTLKLSGNDTYFSKSTQRTLYGRLKVFPEDQLITGLEMLVAVGDSSKLYYVQYDQAGNFSFQTEQVNTVGKLRINFSDPKSRRKVIYYPIEIENVEFEGDSIKLGIIPLTVDSSDYFEEWGNSGKSGLFKKKINYWSSTITDMDNCLKKEDKLNKVYYSFCNQCNPIFITEKHSKKNKNYVAYWEIRKFVIDYHELLELRDYFEPDFTKKETYAREFINYMKNLPEGNFRDRFSKTVSEFYIKNNLTHHDSISLSMFTFPELPNGLFEKSSELILEHIELSEDEKKEIDNQLVFFMKVNRNSSIEELELLSLINSKNRYKINEVLSKLRSIKLYPVKSRGRAVGYLGAWYIDL